MLSTVRRIRKVECNARIRVSLERMEGMATRKRIARSCLKNVASIFALADAGSSGKYFLLASNSDWGVFFTLI